MPASFRGGSTAAGSSPRAGWEALDAIEEYRHACRVRAEHVVPVREPLVLVSQVQRSGGTLLSRLFDGHPECHAHPYELKIDSTKPDRWPAIDLASPDTWFPTLYETEAARHLIGGYSKPGLKSTAVDVFPFLFLPRLQKLLFDQCASAGHVERERDVLDYYFTSYFNAWLDNHNLHSGPKRVVTAFMPRVSLHLPSVERFFAAYPDGTLVSMIREPRAWYASAARHRPQYQDLERALGLWRKSADAAFEAGRRFAGRVVILTYERLVLETEAVMERLGERVGITMSPALLLPTFNGRAIGANSSDPIDGFGVLADRIDAYRNVLEASVIARVDELAGDVYERARSKSL